MNIDKAIEVLKDYRKGEFVGDDEFCEAIDTVVSFYESPQNESEEIPETLKGKAYDYMTQMKTLIKNQHTMTPDLFIANAMSIVCYAYSAGVDFVVDTLKLEAGRKEATKSLDKVICPECLKVTTKEELHMFGGLCEDCTNECKD